MALKTSNLTPQFAYNAKARQYVDVRSGRFVTRQAVRDALDGFVDAASVRMATLGERLRNGQLSVADWQIQMAREIKLAHLAAAAAANGGWAQLSKADYGRIGARVKEQYKFLRNFAAQVASGEQPLDGTLAVRAELYGQAARGTYEEEKRRLEEIAGKTQEKRVLGAADHCQSQPGLPGCLELAGQGWKPIGSLPKIGQTPCKVRCRCHFEFR